MEVKTTAVVTLSLERYNEVVRLLNIYSQKSASADVGTNTNSEALDWLENVSGMAWQDCPVHGCYANRRCLLVGTNPVDYGNCRGNGSHISGTAVETGSRCKI